MSSTDDRTPGSVADAIRARWRQEPASGALPPEDPDLAAAITKLAEGLDGADPPRKPPPLIMAGGVDEARAYVAPIAPVEHPEHRPIEVAKVQIARRADPRHALTEVVQRVPAEGGARSGGESRPPWIARGRRAISIAGAVAGAVLVFVALAFLRAPTRVAKATAVSAALPAPRWAALPQGSPDDPPGDSSSPSAPSAPSAPSTPSAPAATAIGSSALSPPATALPSASSEAPAPITSSRTSAAPAQGGFPAAVPAPRAPIGTARPRAPTPTTSVSAAAPVTTAPQAIFTKDE